MDVFLNIIGKWDYIKIPGTPGKIGHRKSNHSLLNDSMTPGATGTIKCAVPKQMLPDIDRSTHNASISRPSDSLGTLSICRGSFLCLLHALFQSFHVRWFISVHVARRPNLAVQKTWLSVTICNSPTLGTENSVSLVISCLFLEIGLHVIASVRLPRRSSLRI